MRQKVGPGFDMTADNVLGDFNIFSWDRHEAFLFSYKKNATENPGLETWPHFEPKI
jgi:hypothetical protein